MRSLLRWSTAACLALVLAACSSGAGTATSSAFSVDRSSGAATPPVTGGLTVLAASSLTASFDDAKAPLEAANPGLSITYSYGGSGALVTQVQQGQPADVIATADTRSMQALVDAGLVEAPVTFARNKLGILVAPGNPKHVTGIQDLARADLVFVTEDDSVPAGKYTAAMLRAAGVTADPVSKEANVSAAVAKVTSGEADVTVVYVTDVLAAGAKGTGVAIPDAQNQIATYPVAVLKAAKDRDAALMFVASALTGAVHDALIARGFLPAG